jgi:hypothetical protein
MYSFSTSKRPKTGRLYIMEKDMYMERHKNNIIDNYNLTYFYDEYVRITLLYGPSLKVRK